MGMIDLLDKKMNLVLFFMGTLKKGKIKGVSMGMICSEDELERRIS